MKPHKRKNNVINVEGKFSQIHNASLSASYLARLDLSQIGELTIRLLNDKNLQVSKVRPFFWSLVEAYVDRFQFYPFDVSKALISYLELKDYPEEMVRQLVEQLESQFEETHGRPLRKSMQSLPPQADTLDDEMKKFRDSLKYAAMVAEVDE